MFRVSPRSLRRSVRRPLLSREGLPAGAARLPQLRPQPPRPVPVPVPVESPDEETTAPHTLSGLIRSVIAAVNARGLCATEAARIAALPPSELRDIESQCGCASCRSRRTQ